MELSILRRRECRPGSPGRCEQLKAWQALSVPVLRVYALWKFEPEVNKGYLLQVAQYVQVGLSVGCEAALNPMSIPYLRFSTFVFSCLLAFAPDSAFTADSFEPVRDFIRAEMIQRQVPSITVAVAKGDKILW